jgi:hypothetical protein
LRGWQQPQRIAVAEFIAGIARLFGPAIAPCTGPLQSLSNDVRSRMRILSKSENARTFLLAIGIVAFFTVMLRYGEHHDQHQISVPACDSDLCSSPVADNTPAASSIEQTPNIGPEQSDGQHGPPAPAPKGVPACDGGSCGNPVADGTPAASNPEQTASIGREQSDGKYRQPAPAPKGNTMGIVTSRKTGARARVGVAYAAQFQAYIDDLENNHGARILFMGGIRPGHCSPSGLHPCGKALDVCQLRRGVVDSRCHLPPRRELAQVASAHGLFEGGRWCNSDYGHAQLGATARDCGDRGTRIVRRQTAPEADPKVSVVSFE